MEIKDKTIARRQILLLIGILSASIVACGYLFHNNQANMIREEKYSDLKAIASLKIDQLVQWQNGRISDARVISQSPFFIHGVEQWLNKKDDIMFKTDIEKPITMLQEENGYESIYLMDNNGEPLLSVGKVLDRLDPVAVEKILNASKADSVVCSDFYYCKLENTIHYDIIVPLRNETNITIAILVLRTNPYSYLYPLIQSWPTPSKTSETLLIHKNGDSVLFLNDLRFHTNAALTIKISLTQKDVPAVQSVMGLEGVFEGKDYRGVEVLSDIRRVPGTSWYMVAKVDKKEIYSNLNLLAILTSLLTGILVLLCGTGIMWVYHYRQRNIYKTLWQTQEEYRTTLYSIGDAVIATDKKGRVKYMNNVAEQLTGWKEHEAKNKPLEEVFRIINENTRTRLENPVQLVLKEEYVTGFANHTLLISKDGKEIPIADSGSPIRDEKNEIIGVVLVFRDQTEERASQKALMESERKFKQVFETTNVGKSMTLPTGEINVNDAYCKMLGYSADELKNKKWQELTPADEIENTELIIGKLLKGEENSARFDKRYIKKDGSYIWADVSAVLIRNDRNEPLHFITTVVDITERKRMEQELHRFAERLELAQDAAGVGVWDWNVVSGHIDWTTMMFVLFGLDKNKDTASFESWRRVLHPEDLAHAEARIMQALDEHVVLVNEYRVVMPDGKIRWINATGKGIYSESGEALRMIGTCTDITERKRAEEAPCLEKDNFRHSLDDSPLGIRIASFEGETIYANKILLDLYGYENLKELQNSPLKDRYTPESYIQAQKRKQLRKQGDFSANDYEVSVVRKNGEVRHLQVWRKEILWDGTRQYQVIYNDITDRKQAEQALQHEKNLAQQYLNIAGVMIVVIGADQNIVLVNRKACQVIGLAEPDLVGKNWFDTVLPEKGRERIKNVFADLLAGKVEPREYVENPILTARGEERLIAWHNTVLKDKNGTIVATLSSGEDITERKKGEEEILRSRKSLEDLYRRLNEIREEERTYVSREMHDQLGQSLTALKMDLNRLKKEISTKPDAVARLNDIIELVSNTIKDVQHISSELRPEILFDLGLVPAIEWYINSFETRSGIKCDLQADDCRYDDEKKNLVLFRVLQEALTNVMRHANATSVSIKLQKTNAGTILSVRDNGIGISKEKADSIESLGILGMRERARQYGGNLDISSRKNKGTTLTITIP